MPGRYKHRKHLHAKHKQSQDPFDYVVYIFGFVTPLFELPQLWEIYSQHRATNVSLATWAFFCVDNLIWIAYGIRKKTWPIVVTSILYEALELTITIGIVLYS